MASKKRTTLKPRRTKHVTLLTEELAKTILELVRQDKSLNEISVELGINKSTIYNWKYENVAGFADALEKAEMEGELHRAKAFSKRLMEMEEMEEGRQNTRLVAIKQKEVEYLRSNLINAKRMYDNRQINNTVVVLPTPILGGMLEKDNEVVPDKAE